MIPNQQFVSVHFLRILRVFTLPETNIAPKNGWLEYYFPIGFRPILRGKLAVSFREGITCVSQTKREALPPDIVV